MAAKKTAKYSPETHAVVEREMKAMEAGTLKSGSGQKVTNRKQAIAIALSEARREGDKVPPNPNQSEARNRAEARAGKAAKAAKKSPAKKAAAKKTAAKKGTTAKKTAAKKAVGAKG